MIFSLETMIPVAQIGNGWVRFVFQGRVYVIDSIGGGGLEGATAIEAVEEPHGKIFIPGRIREMRYDESLADLIQAARR